MKQKKTIYVLLMAVGAVLLLAALGAWKLSAPDRIGGMLTGAGSGLLAIGFANWKMMRWTEKDPERMRRDEIEAGDERNVAIRRRAQAVAGEVLQWGLIAAAWVSIGLGAPLWVTLAAVGVFCGKTVLELCLMVRYQREM
ncbi:MAG: hypothetical protein HFG09_07270 [Oscillibacter sp.]|nr:hypothetical protein [Oscillibacter sp.]